MTDEILEVPVVEEPTPEEASEPLAITLTIQFEDPTGAIDATTLGTRVTQPHSMSAIDYAKAVAEMVERTVLLQMGALPVLQPIKESE